MKQLLLLLFLFPFRLFSQSLTPEITSWILNTNGETGYNGIPSNVQEVQYSDNNVYVSCTCIPGYDIGPWPGNPNTPVDQNFVFKITRHPQQNTGTAIATPLGHIGVWSNGVSIFNAEDAHSYNNVNVWHQDAVVVEGSSFDDCLGHPSPSGEYHHHLNPTCLYDDNNTSIHSPIIGYAFDGFPVYGAYGFSNVDGSGGIVRMRSGYGLRNITTRTTLPDGTVLTANQYGPDVNGQYPLGYYIEDYEYVQELGDLDEHNGRFCVTPEYPAGTYAYFVTLDSNLNGQYPYTLGPTYYGTVQAGNTGPDSGHNTITESVTVYSSVDEVNDVVRFSVFPNPSSDFISVLIDPSQHANMKASLLNDAGQLISQLDNVQSAVQYSFDLSSLPDGVYFLRIGCENFCVMKKVVKTK